MRQVTLASERLMVRFITENQVKHILTYPKAIELVELAFRDRAEGHAHDVPRVRTRQPTGHLHILQGAAPRLNVIGYKAYYTRPGGRTSMTHLHNMETAVLEGMVQSDYLGKVRTAAATAVATRALSRPDAEIVACFGLGRHGPAQLEAVCNVRRIKEVRAYGRNKDRQANFCATMSKKLGIEVKPVDSPADALRGAHIINVMTRPSGPVFDGKLLEPGQHVNASGVNSMDKREIDLETIRRAEVVVVDSREVAQVESGDLLPAIEAGLIYWENLADLGDILVGRRQGRTSEREITLFKSHGMCIQDLYVGKHVLDVARETHVGIDLPMTS